MIHFHEWLEVNHPEALANFHQTFKPISGLHGGSHRPTIDQPKGIKYGLEGEIRNAAILGSTQLKVELKYFKPSELIFTQSTGQRPETVKDFINQGEPSKNWKPKNIEEMPIVIKKNNKLYLLDGHHRAEWHHYYGDIPMQVLYHDTDVNN